MAKLKITVLERTFNQEIADEFGSEAFKNGRGFGPCPNFVEGQKFILDGLGKPAHFCSSAWADIHGIIRTVAFGGEQAFMQTRNAAMA